MPHYLRVAESYNCDESKDALLWYLIWLEGGGSYEIGKKRGTHVNYHIIETKRHFYFKRNGVLTFVRKTTREQNYDRERISQ